MIDEHAALGNKRADGRVRGGALQLHELELSRQPRAFHPHSDQHDLHGALRGVALESSCVEQASAGLSACLEGWPSVKFVHRSAASPRAARRLCDLCVDGMVLMRAWGI